MIWISLPVSLLDGMASKERADASVEETYLKFQLFFQNIKQPEFQTDEN